MYDAMQPELDLIWGIKDLIGVEVEEKRVVGRVHAAEDGTE